MKKSTSEIVAYTVRVISVPPVLFAGLLGALYLIYGEAFASVTQLAAAFFLSAVLPLTAYPLARVLPHFKAKGRDGERKLAFILNLSGYTLALIYGIAAQVSRELMLIFAVYFLSTVLLTILNKVFHIKASGHGCCMTAVLLLFIYLIDWALVLPCAAFYGVVLWASLKLKRHTAKEFLLGSTACLLSFLLGIVLM